MANWAHLPYEILLKIFEHLPLKEGLQCRYTCLVWSKPSAECLFKEITLTESSKATAFLQAVSNSPDECGKLVKVLALGALFGTGSSLHPMNIFPAIAQLCPNIQKFSCSQFDLIGSILIQLREDGYWQSLEEFPMHTYYKENYEGYVNFVIAYRSTLKKLYLGEPTYFSEEMGDDVIDDQGYKKLSRLLTEFISLVYLKIECSTPKTVLDLDSIVDDCPLLSSIEFNPIHGNINSRAIQRHHTRKDLSVIIPHLNIKRFEGVGTTFDNNSMNYFMHKFPNLEKLVLGASDPASELSISDPMFDFTSETMTRFVSYILPIQAVDVYSPLDDDDIVSLLRKFMDVTGGKDMVVSIIYAAENDYYDIYPHLAICKGKCFYPGERYTEIATSRDKLILGANLQVNNDDAAAFPHIRIIEQLGADLKELYFSMGEVIGRNPQLFHQTVQQTLSGFPVLERLALDYQNLLSSLKDLTVTNNSIHTLKIIGHYDDTYTVLCNLSRSLPSLKYLHIDIRNNFPGAIGRFILISMPDSHLENITWDATQAVFYARGARKADVLKSFYVCLAENTGDSLFKVDKTNTQRIGLTEYVGAEFDSMVSFQIQCAYLKTFTVKYRDFHEVCKIH